MSGDTQAPAGPLPGVVAAVVVAVAAHYGADALGAALLDAQGITGGRNPVSSITVAILLGLLVANTAGVPARCAPGLTVAVKKLLKVGIILVGLKLSFRAVLTAGAAVIPVVAVIVTFAIFFATRLAAKLGLSDRLGVLAGVSTAICGVTAAVAVSSTIDAEDDEVAYTVANVTLFGMAAMLTYPYLAHALFGGDSGAAGLFLGVAIHDTAQAVGAAMSYRELYSDEVAMQVATVVKLTRNVFLVAVVPAMAYRHAKRTGGAAAEVRALDHFPLFVLGFLGMALLRTAGDAGVAAGGAALGVLDAARWKLALKALGGTAAKAALTVAMAAVGLKTRVASLRGLGLGPLYVGAASALVVGVAGAAAASQLGRYLAP